MAKKNKSSIVPKKSKEYKDLMKLRKQLKEIIKLLEDKKQEADKQQTLIINNQ